MPNPYMDPGPSASDVRERRRGIPSRSSRRSSTSTAAPQQSADDKAARLRAQADERVAGTVADVVAWVGKSTAKAEAALAAEQAGAQRVSLIRKLEAVAG